MLASSLPHNLAESLLFFAVKDEVDALPRQPHNLLPRQPEMLRNEAVFLGERALEDTYIIRLSRPHMLDSAF